MKRAFRWAIVALLTLLAGAWLWQRFGTSEEKRVQRVIGKMQQLVEQRSGALLAAGLEPCVAQDFTGMGGANKTLVIQAVVGYREMCSSASIHITNLKISVTPATETAAATAEAEFEARIVAQNKSGQAGTVEQYSDRYKLKFRKGETGWQMTHAQGNKEHNF